MDIPPVYTTTTTTSPSLPPQPPEYPTNPNDSENDPPPSYAFPQTFTIGRTRTQAPLVSSEQVKGHLTLLHAFATLREQVDRLDAGVREEIRFMPEEKDTRWAWFVGLAVERFSLWCGSLMYEDSSRDAEDFLPPLDVLMVWHAYMLNPGWYAEDCTRIPALRYLHQATPVFSTSLTLPTLKPILLSDPTQTRLDSWTTRTGKLWDPLEDAQKHQTRDIRCPKCRRLITIPYMTREGTGFLQHDFQTRCTKPSCTTLPPITKAVLGVRKLAEDLTREVGVDQERWNLAGTLRTSTTASDLARGKVVKDAILSSPQFQQPPHPGGYARPEEWTQAILEGVGYSDVVMRKGVEGRMKGRGGNLVKRIFLAYADGERVSVDLAGAVIRQGSFVKKMHDLQWTEPGFFDTKEDEVALQHAIARYHAFLDLMAASPVTFYVPTLDIDLAWHTHQLAGGPYNMDCKRYVGRYIDHDDKVEEETLATAFDVTCRAWQNRFDLPYTHCGCPLPGHTIGQRLSRLSLSLTRTHSSSLSSSSSSPSPSPSSSFSFSFSSVRPSYLVPPPREDLRAGTHPSDHNAVFLFHRRHAGEAARTRRREKFRRRVERDRERREKEEAAGKGKGKGKGKGWGVNMNKGEKSQSKSKSVEEKEKGLGGRAMTAEERRKADERRGYGYAHDPAFLMPVPLFYYGYGYGAGCAAYAGNVVYTSSAGSAGVGGCAAGGGACAAGGSTCGAGGACGGGGGGGDGGGGGGCGGGGCGGGGCGGGG